MFYTGLLDLHSLLRYIILLLLLATIAKSFTSWISRKHYSGKDNLLALLSMIFVHLQLVVGLTLYFISPFVEAGLSDMGAAMKNPELRFWTVEHVSIMLVGIILITVGRISSKKAVDGAKKHKRIFLYYFIGLIIMLAGIPWPFSQIARPWF